MFEFHHVHISMTHICRRSWFIDVSEWDFHLVQMASENIGTAGGERILLRYAIA